jgi:hypothetical protein
VITPATATAITLVMHPEARSAAWLALASASDEIKERERHDLQWDEEEQRETWKTSKRRERDGGCSSQRAERCGGKQDRQEGIA